MLITKNNTQYVINILLGFDDWPSINDSRSIGDFQSCQGLELVKCIIIAHFEGKFTWKMDIRAKLCN